MKVSPIAFVVVTVAVVSVIAFYGRDKKQPPLVAGRQADLIAVDKTHHAMMLFSGAQPLRTYAVSLGRGGLGAKIREGDNRTPEGRYRVDGRNPRSAFHLSLHISYPDVQDVAAASARGEKPGGDIMIHGLRNGFGWLGPLHRLADWTAGCIAVTDAEIEEIWQTVPDGTPVEVRR
jgi:murein L,D-transpeptidase YafK